MLSGSMYNQKTNIMGKAKEKMLLSKMISILTPSNDGQNSDISDITFENLLIFLATVNNIEIPYRESVKEEISKIKTLKDFKAEKLNGHCENNGTHLEMKMSETGLLSLLPSYDKSASLRSNNRSKYKYGYFNSNGTIIFTDDEKKKIHKEFIMFATNRREQLALKQKVKTENKKNQILHEFDYVPKVNKNGMIVYLWSLAQRPFGISEMIHGEVPVFDNLIKKGQEYEAKKQIKRDLEKSIDKEDCTFRPYLSPNSKRLADYRGNSRERLLTNWDHSKVWDRVCDKTPNKGVTQLSDKLRMYKENLRKGPLYNTHKKAKSPVVVFKNNSRVHDGSSSRMSELD